MPRLKMGTGKSLASRSTLLPLAMLATCALQGAMTHNAIAAMYSPGAFFVTASFSFDVINPNDLNNLTGGTAPFPGLIGGRLQVERGLFTPSWSHWMELEYFSGSSSASGDAGNISQSLSYWAILPVGVTYWFARTAYIDFGVSAGGGFGLAPSYSLTAPAGKPAVDTTTNYTGKFGPLGTARLDARFWINKHFAATFAGGLHVYSSALSAPNGAGATGALSGISMVAGLTYAFGGVHGNGHSYVEVIHDKPDAKKPTPTRPKTPPAGAKTPAQPNASASPKPTAQPSAAPTK